MVRSEQEFARKGRSEKRQLERKENKLTIPEGINEEVWVSPTDFLFHNERHCSECTSSNNLSKCFYLELKGESQPCNWCCANFYYLQGQPRFLIARINGVLMNAHLLATRPTDGVYTEYRVRTLDGIESVLRKKTLKKL